MANQTVKFGNQIFEVVSNPTPSSPQDTKRLQIIDESQLAGRTPLEVSPESLGIDPRTGLSKLQATEGLSGIQNLTPLSGVVSNAPAGQAATPGATPDVYSAANISQGSEPIRGEIEDFRRTTANLDQMLNEPSIQSFLGSQTFGETPEGAQELADIRKMAKQVGTLTPEQLAAIESSGVAAGEAIAPGIRGAEEEKRQGLPRALIEAGERGGLMNTQFAGLAALAPTVGGTFFGAGGQLERIKSVYDRNIADLRTQQVLATQQAREAARRAELTRNREDLQQAAQLFTLARDTRDKAVELAAEKARFNLDVQRLEEAKRSREFQEQMETSREQRGIQGQRFEQELAGRGEAREAGRFGLEQQRLQTEQQERTRQIQREQETDALNTLTQISSVGGAVPTTIRQVIDKKYGTGFSEKVLEADRLEREARTEEQTFKAQKAHAEVDKVLTESAKIESDIERQQFLTERDRTLLPLEAQKIQSEIRQNVAQASKALRGESSDSGFNITDILEGTANIFAEHFGSDGKLDTGIYKRAKNEFVQQFKSNKEFYDKLFIRNFPPTKLLNLKDPTAQPYINQEKNIGKTPVINFSIGD